MRADPSTVSYGVAHIAAQSVSVHDYNRRVIVELPEIFPEENIDMALLNRIPSAATMGYRKPPRSPAPSTHFSTIEVG